MPRVTVSTASDFNLSSEDSILGIRYSKQPQTTKFWAILLCSINIHSYYSAALLVFLSLLLVLLSDICMYVITIKHSLCLQWIYWLFNVRLLLFRIFRIYWHTFSFLLFNVSTHFNHTSCGLKILFVRYSLFVLYFIILNLISVSRLFWYFYLNEFIWWHYK